MTDAETLTSLAARVDALRANHDDDERSHYAEDEIREDALKAIARSAPEPWRSLAAEALKTGDIVFARWYA